MKTNSFCLLLLLLYLLVNWHSINAKELNIVTTLPSLANLTEEIGGEYVDVYSITKGVQDAHYVEAKPSYMLKLNKADLLIYSGLELEIGWLPLLIQGARNNQVAVGGRGNLNASLAISQNHILEKPRGEVDRSMGDVHPAGNPHYLLNPNNALSLIDYITEKLTELDPDHGEFYQSNADIYYKKIEDQILDWEEKASVLKGKEIVCYHVHWSYLLDWLGINLAGYIEMRPGIPPTPRHKREIIRLMEDRNIKVVIISSWKEPTKAREVAQAVDGELLILPGEVDAVSGTSTYIEWIDYMVNELLGTTMADSSFEQQPVQQRQRKRIRGGN
jgi:zinc/manganese transport system substrate-binding protein